MIKLLINRDETQEGLEHNNSQANLKKRVIKLQFVTTKNTNKLKRKEEYQFTCDATFKLSNSFSHFIIFNSSIET